MSTAEKQKAYSRDEAARLYGVSLDTIRRAINTGQLRAKKVGRVIRVDEKSLEDWFKNLPDA